MSRRDIPVCPSDVMICRRSCAEPGSGLFAAHFLPHDVTFSINRWCQVPPCGENWRMYTSRSSCQNALRPWPWSYFVDHEILFYFVQRVNISKLIYLCIYNKNCRQANGDNAILSRMCRQVWIGTFGICRLRAHQSRRKQTRSAYPDVPTGTFGTCKQVLPCINFHTDSRGHGRSYEVRGIR